MYNIYYIIFFQILINLLIIKNFHIIANIVDIYDIPGKRKKHKNPIATLGGSVFFLNYLYIYLVGNYLLPEIFPVDITFIFFSSLIFLVGITDDKINLNANLKFLLFVIIILIHLSFDNKFLIYNLNIDFLAISFDLNIYQSYFFTLLCILLFMNASNLFDGINLQFGIYLIILFVYLIYKDPSAHYLKLLIIPIVFFLYLNYKNECFFGDSGTLFVSYFLSLIIINQNNDLNILSVSEILLLMTIPGIDMLRLFVFRLIKSKNPFCGDRDHLHHHLINKFNLINTNIILASLTLLPIILFNFFSNYFLFILFLLVIFYIFILISVKKL